MIYTFLSFRIPYRFCGRSFNSLSRVKFMVGPSTWAKVSLMSINLKVHIELHDHVLINHSWSTPLFGQSWPLHVCSILHPAPLHLDVMVILYLPPVATVVTESQIIAKKWISLFCDLVPFPWLSTNTTITDLKLPPPCRFGVTSSWLARSRRHDYWSHRYNPCHIAPRTHNPTHAARTGCNFAALHACTLAVASAEPHQPRAAAAPKPRRPGPAMAATSIVDTYSRDSSPSPSRAHGSMHVSLQWARLTGRREEDEEEEEKQNKRKELQWAPRSAAPRWPPCVRASTAAPRRPIVPGVRTEAGAESRIPHPCWGCRRAEPCLRRRTATCTSGHRAHGRPPRLHRASALAPSNGSVPSLWPLPKHRGRTKATRCDAVAVGLA